jgi:HK97 family phage major capsid protein
VSKKDMKAILAQMRELANREDAATKEGDGGRKAEAADGRAAVAKQFVAADTEKLGDEIKKGRKASTDQRVEELTKFLYDKRKGSKAALVGPGKSLASGMFGSRIKGNSAGVRPVAALKASFQNYRAGEFIAAYAGAKGYLTDWRDAEVEMAAKAKLNEFALWAGPPDRSSALLLIGGDGKATLGTSGATGGYVLPNNLVDSVIKPNVQQAIYPTMGVRVIGGVAVRGVDQPYRTGVPLRAQFADWGASKQNVDEAYGSYTATLGTLAKIYDVGKQYLRFSAGSAEQDVMDELTKSFALAENYAIIAGPGTGAITPGVNDPTYGLYTALLAGAASYTSAIASPSNSTIVGSFAAGLQVASAQLRARSRASQGWVVDATTFSTVIAQGTDAAGFFVNPAGGPTGFRMTDSGQLTFWGVPIYFDANLGTNATTKIAIGGEWDALKLYRGIEFRIDSSDVAGTRWDQNLVGFRGEEEIGIHAGSAVSVGAFQLLTAAIA